jgi:hypothetical protein
MAILIDPNNVKVISQNGQVTLALQIELNINLNGNITAQEQSSSSNNFKASSSPIKNAADEEAAWLVPDFNSKEKVKFGK